MEEGPVVDVNIATYNVKRFEMKDPRSIVALLMAEHIDVCGMQEVPGKKALDQLLKNTPYEGVFLGPYWTYGIALVYKKTAFSVVGKPKLHMLKDGQGKKAALEVTVTQANVNKQLTIFVTHLDHRTEPQRMFEMSALLKVQKPQSHLLLGDMNALKRSDYTDADWDKITEVRKASGWELPQVELTETIERVGGYIDLLSAASASSAIIPTSRFDTRVDYIFATPDIVCTSASVIVNTLNESDHKPIVVRIKI
jgi:endonuclease/exonuclease/phosphatase family metal-dependent hydrolase